MKTPVKKTTKSAQQKAEMVVIKTLQRSAMKVYLMGDSPLIVHAWDQKARLELLQKHMQHITVRAPKDPYQQFLRCLYRLEDLAYGFPVAGVKEAMATMTVDLEGVSKAQIYRNIWVTGRRGFQYAAFANLRTPHELAEVFSPGPPQVREDMVRLSGISRTPDVRYRAEFFPWALRFSLAYLPEFISNESILNLIHHAGARIGLGEWRQEKGGSNGAFHVADAVESKSIERWIAAGQKEPDVIDVDAWVRSLQPPKKEDPGMPLDEVLAAGKTKRRRGNGAEQQP